MSGPVAHTRATAVPEPAPDARRVLVVECLDAPGAGPADAAARVAALEAAGFEAHGLVWSPRGEASSPGGDLDAGVPEGIALATGRPDLVETIARVRPARVVIAAAAAVGAVWGDLPACPQPALWWPTGVGVAAVPRGPGPWRR